MTTGTQDTWLIHSEKGETRRVPVGTGTGKDENGVFWAPVAGTSTVGVPIVMGPDPLAGGTPDNSSLRYPSDALISEKSDFVFFQFGKYIPPFSDTAVGGAAENEYQQYQESTGIRLSLIHISEPTRPY